MTASNPDLTDPTAELGLLMEAAPDAMLVTDPTGRIVEINQRCLDLVGYDAEELLGEPVELLMAAELRERHQTRHAHYISNPASRDMATGSLNQALIRKDGAEIPVEVALNLLDTEAGPRVLASIRDVTRARRDERLFRMLLESSPDPVVVLEPHGSIVLLNALTEELLGYDRSELIGTPFETIVPERLHGTFRHLREEYKPRPDPELTQIAGLLSARRKDGDEVPVVVTTATLKTADGVLIRVNLHDVTQQLEMSSAVAEAQQRQQVQVELNRLKDVFIANLSHEMRTPLTSMVGFLELISDSGELTGETADFLAIVQRNTARELRLVDDLLSLYKLQESQFEFDLYQLDLVAVVEAAVAGASGRASHAEIDLSAELPKHPVTVAGDVERLGQVLDNLLSNAVKFTSPGGSVIVRLNTTDRVARVEVTDTGIGIVGHPDQIFERLYRSPNAIANQIPGAGIGLSIAEAIASAHDGSLRVLDTSKLGTTMLLEIPLAEPASAASACPEAG